MSGHVVDRFVEACRTVGVWGENPIPPGHFRASPEVARMLEWHVTEHPGLCPPDRIFDRPVLADPALVRGRVVFEPDR